MNENTKWPWYPYLLRMGVGAGWLASPFVPKLRTGLRARKGLLERLKEVSQEWEECVWFHVASSGELEQAIPVMEALKAQRPGTRIFLSYFSPSGAVGVERERSRRLKDIPWDYADYCPMDYIDSVGKVLEILKVRAFVTVHREVWPGILTALRKAHVPALLIAADVNPRKPRQFHLMKDWYQHFEYIGASHEVSQKFLKAQLEREIPCPGDPRTTRIIDRARRSEAGWKNSLGSAPTLVAGSIWPKDFEALKQTLKTLLQFHPEYRFILAPHEPTAEFVREILDWGKAEGHTWSRWSRSQTRHGHLVVDQVGILAELYEAASIAFVGGSFQGKVHNVLEPAVFEIPLLTGPYIDNSKEALKLERTGALWRAKTPAALAAKALSLVGDEDGKKTAAMACHEFFNQHLQAASQYAKAINDALI